MENKNLHEIAVTAIIAKDGKYLVTRRTLSKKRFPGMWTVPGGRLEISDYQAMAKDTPHSWYNVLERTLRREVKEEVGLEIKNIDYVTSIATIYGETPSLIISCTADYADGEVTLQKDELDQYNWVTLEEAKEYNFIEGIYDEIVMVDKKRKGGFAEEKERLEWQKNTQ